MRNGIRNRENSRDGIRCDQTYRFLCTRHRVDNLCKACAGCKWTGDLIAVGEFNFERHCFVGDSNPFQRCVNATSVRATARAFGKLRPVTREYLNKESLHTQFPAICPGRLDSYTTQSVAEVCTDVYRANTASSHSTHFFVSVYELGWQRRATGGGPYNVVESRYVEDMKGAGALGPT